MAVLVLCGTVCFGEDAWRPPCNARNRGRLWPEQANSDPNAARRAGRCGELLICTPSVWKYHWRPLTVHINKLGKGPKREIPGCGEANTVAKNQAAGDPPSN